MLCSGPQITVKKLMEKRRHASGWGSKRLFSAADLEKTRRPKMPEALKVLERISGQMGHDEGFQAYNSLAEEMTCISINKHICMNNVHLCLKTSSYLRPDDLNNVHLCLKTSSYLPPNDLILYVCNCNYPIPESCNHSFQKWESC